MRARWEENQERDFMIINKNILAVLILIVLAGFISCKPDESDDEIPYVPFADININLGLPEFFPLQASGGYKLINEGGVKGIILYHHPGGEYYAFERNCSYHPNDACSTVDVDFTGVRMTDSCCGSSFNFDGNPVNGPAWRPLRRYVTIHSANQVTITSDIVE
jgi:hypothetical protein